MKTKKVLILTKENKKKVKKILIDDINKNKGTNMIK